MPSRMPRLTSPHTEDEVDRAIAILSTGVKRLRSLSPLYAQRGAA
mgnify:CR=1 FL=1